MIAKSAISIKRKARLNEKKQNTVGATVVVIRVRVGIIGVRG